MKEAEKKMEPELRFPGFEGGWPSGRVGDYLTLQRGFDLTKKQCQPGNYPVYSSSGISYYHNEFKVEGPGIVTGRKGSVGPVFLIKGKFWPHDTSLWVKDFKGNLVSYIFHFLIQLKLERHDESSSVPTLNRNNVHRLKTAFPTLPEQQKIADFLTAVDARISQLIQKKALLEDYKKGLMQQLFSQTLRFKDDHGNDFPEWDFVSMVDLYPKIRNGFVGTATPFYCDNGVQYVQGRNIKSGKIVNNGFVSITEAFHQKCAKSRLRTNDILMVQSGHVGECAVVTEDFNDSNCHAVLVLTPRDNQLDSRFYVSYFYSYYGMKSIHKIRTGNTISHILSSDLKKEKAPFPTLPEQRKIADCLSALDRRIESLATRISLTQEFKKGLLQKMFV